MKGKQTKQAFGISLFLTVCLNVIQLILVKNNDGQTVTVSNQSVKRASALLMVIISFVLVCGVAVAMYYAATYAISSHNVLGFIGTAILLFVVVRLILIMGKGWKNL